MISLREHAELGNIAWQRDFEAGVAEAESTNKPIFLLFQEVPGCSTCVRFGQDVLTHPLMVELIETEFVPIAIHNNKPGKDAEILRRFREAAWNNPVVHFLNPDESELLPKLADRYDAIGLHDKLTRALELRGVEVPEYFRLLRGDLLVEYGVAEKRTYETACFWSGETSLAQSPSVISTDAGWIDGEEVVEVQFDTQRSSRDGLDEFAEVEGFAPVASRNFRLDKSPQYYLAKSDFRHLPLTPAQRTRINLAIPYGQNPEQFLSPTQLGWLQDLRAGRRASSAPDYYRYDIRRAWMELAKAA